MATTNITSAQQYDEAIQSAPAGKQVIVDFWAAWCGPCRALSPILERMEAEGVIDLIKVDVDANPELSQEFQVRSIPTMLFYQDGKQNKPAFIGAAPEAAIKQHIGL